MVFAGLAVALGWGLTRDPKVLPSALMSRGSPEFRMVYDPFDLKMRSCLGWSEEDLAASVAFVTERARAEDGQVGEYFWVFPP